MRLAVVGAGVTLHVDGRGRLGDRDGNAAAGGFVVVVSGEAPIGGATGDVDERRAEVQEGIEVFTQNAGGRARGAVRLAVVGAGVTLHVDGRGRLGDRDGNAAAGGFVVVVSGEAPIGGATGDVDERRAEVQEGIEVFTQNAGGRARGAVRLAVVGAGVTLDIDGRVRLRDGDGNAAAGGFVVVVAREGPIGCAAREVGERFPEVQEGVEVFTENSSSRPSRAVCLTVVGAGVTVHDDRGGRRSHREADGLCDRTAARGWGERGRQCVGARVEDGARRRRVAEAARNVSRRVQLSVAEGRAVNDGCGIVPSDNWSRWSDRQRALAFRVIIVRCGNLHGERIRARCRRRVDRERQRAGREHIVAVRGEVRG